MRAQARPCSVKALDVFSLSLYCHALLAHIYAKVAICKSCERSSRRHSQNRLSPGNPRFVPNIVPAIAARKVTVWGWSPAEISSSPERFPYVLFVPRASTKYPLKDGCWAIFFDQSSLLPAAKSASAHHWLASSTLEFMPTRSRVTQAWGFGYLHDLPWEYPRVTSSPLIRLLTAETSLLQQGITAATSSL